MKDKMLITEVIVDDKSLFNGAEVRHKKSGKVRKIFVLPDGMRISEAVEQKLFNMDTHVEYETVMNNKHLFELVKDDDELVQNPMEDFLDMDTKTKHGIDKLDLLLRFMAIIEPQTGKLQTNLVRFKSFLVEKLKRGITVEEERNLLQGLHDYVVSEAGSRERFKAMEYLFNLKFLND